MADTPSLIYNDTPGAVPATYTFPQALEARLSSVSAMFDGSGAGEDFLACLAIYSQDDKLIGRFFPEAVPAGDAAEVTFAPFLGSTAAAASGAFPPYLEYPLELDLRNAATPAVGGNSVWITVPLADGAPLGGYGALFGTCNLFVDDPGIGTPAVPSYYMFEPTQYLDSSKQSDVFVFGAGVTYPGGVPYAAFLTGVASPFASITVPNVVDPDFGTNFNQARPLWPAAYAPGDVLFSGFWQVALHNE